MSTNEALVKAYKETGDSRYLGEILTQNKGIIVLIAKEYKIPSYTIDDLMNEAFFPLLDAISYYDETKGEFLPMYKSCLSQHFKGLYNKTHCGKRYNGEDDSVDEIMEKAEEDGYGGLSRCFAVICKDYTDIELKDCLARLNLTDKEKVVVDVLMAGGSKGDAAKVLSAGSTNVSYYVSTIKSKMMSAGLRVA